MNDERIKLANDAEVDDVPKFGRLRAAQVEKIMLDAGDEEKKAAFGVAKNWPVIRFVDTKFQGQLTMSPIRTETTDTMLCAKLWEKRSLRLDRSSISPSSFE